MEFFVLEMICWFQRICIFFYKNNYNINSIQGIKNIIPNWKFSIKYLRNSTFRLGFAFFYFYFIFIYKIILMYYTIKLSISLCYMNICFPSNITNKDKFLRNILLCKLLNIIIKMNVVIQFHFFKLLWEWLYHSLLYGS